MTSTPDRMKLLLARVASGEALAAAAAREAFDAKGLEDATTAWLAEKSLGLGDIVHTIPAAAALRMRTSAGARIGCGRVRM